MTFSEKTFWITGASSGIGKAMALLLSKNHSSILLSARNNERLQEVAKECKELGARKVEILSLDMEDIDALGKSVDKALLIMGSIDVLVSAAGFSQRSTILDTSMENLKRLMQVHYFGSAQISKDILPHFLERGSGRFVVLSSLSGKFGVPLRSGYAAAKHALHGFFDSLRAEYESSDIAVNIICPGYIKTNISLNALSTGGGTHGKMDKNQERGMPAEECARQILKAIKKNKAETYIGGKEIYAIYIKRFFPRLLNRLVSKAVSEQ